MGHNISYEEIKNLSKDKLIELVWLLLQKVESLESQLAKNSHNSSKPPSSDGFNKPKPKSLRKKSKRKSGGQPGHEGHTLQMSTSPDVIEILHNEHCKQCDQSLHGVKPLDYESRQVFDIVIKIEVTEFRAERKICSCGATTIADFPMQVSKKVQYGSKMRALLVYMNKYQLIPSERTVAIIRDTTGHVISEGTLHNSVMTCYRGLSSFEMHAMSLLIAAPVVGFDETGARCMNKLMWIHTACTSRLTLLFLHAKRGRVAMDAFGILPNFHGIAVHDYLKAYYSYACLHALCAAHLLRELTFLFEEEKRKWAGKIIDLLLKMHGKVKSAKENGREALHTRTLNILEAEYDVLTRAASRNTPRSQVRTGKRGRVKQSKARNLLDRLSDRQDEVLRFLRDFQTPFDNNASERSFRMTKVQQKISGCFRSFEGGQMFCRIRSYIETVKKNDHTVLESIAQVFEGKPFMPMRC